MTKSILPSSNRRRPSDWLGVALVAIVWMVYLVLSLLDVQSFAGFLTMLGTSLVIALLFAAWWLTRSSFTLTQRLLTIVCAIVPAVLVGAMSGQAIKPLLLLFGLPIVLTASALWIPVSTSLRSSQRLAVLAAFIVLGWSLFLIVRAEGMQGNMRADLHWRWTPSTEERYLEGRPLLAVASTQPATQPLELGTRDWPAFRGPGRDGVVRGLSIATDWAQSSPAVLWRQRVGPAWSSMAVVEGVVFTQEQRGEREAVVSRDATTGRELWAHETPGRFNEAMSGPGPRATPTFATGRIYAQGAMGALNCLDAVTGALLWSRDVRSDAGAAVPMWGFCNSPLVLSDRVIVFAGGEGKKGLLAYPLDGGAPLWSADAGKISYASPQQFDMGGEHPIIMFTNEGLFAADPDTGRLIWQFPVTGSMGVPSTLQPCLVGPGSLVLGNGAAFGLERLAVSVDDRAATRAWVTRQMKPSFSDMVFHAGFLYGFDGTVFCCMDAASGARKWREGRYGAGQVLLLADQGVMIVVTEDGQAVLLRCNPDHSEELGRIPVVTGKTWNHPAIADDRLYVRSDAELACVQLRAVGTPQSQPTANRAMRR